MAEADASCQGHLRALLGKGSLTVTVSLVDRCNAAPQVCLVHASGGGGHASVCKTCADGLEIGMQCVHPNCEVGRARSISLVPSCESPPLI